jgi:hypothetical protein
VLREHVAAAGLNSGKKSFGSAAVVPYRKKSYHSMAVPIKLANAPAVCMSWQKLRCRFRVLDYYSGTMVTTVTTLRFDAPYTKVTVTTYKQRGVR